MKISTEDRTNKRKRLRRFIYLFSFIVLIGIFTFILRGPQVSDALKKLILPELEAAFGQNVIVQKIHVNIFPLFIEAKGIKVFDESGDRILSAKRVKGYVEFPGLFRKK
ncbi:MAG: hypothetical protein FJ243_02980, partial [Nitrospira sp.]|nr:hypothetical protein [Nitrospira sp.]